MRTYGMLYCLNVLYMPCKIDREMKYADKLSDFKLAPQLVAMKQLPLGQLCDVWLFSDVSVSLRIMSVISAVYISVFLFTI